MKKLITAATVAAIMTLAGANAVAQTPETTGQTSELKVRITGIRDTKGTVMVALGDHTKKAAWVSNMVAASDSKDGIVECTLSGNIDLGANLYAFLDTNSNFSLDRNEHGIPTEGCAYGPIALDSNGTATVKLEYLD